MKFASLKCFMVWLLKQYCQTSIADRIPTTLHIPSNDFQGRIAHCGLPWSKREKLPRNRATHYADYGNETTVWYFHLKQLHAVKIVHEIRNSHLWTPTVMYTIPSSMCSGLLWTQPVIMNINRIFNWWRVTGDWNECMETSIFSSVSMFVWTACVVEQVSLLPPVATLCIGTLEEDGHGFICWSCLHLHEVGLAVFTLGARLCKR